ncbi:MAG TPA: aspartate/glutamate racemase family protein [Spirochaetia bacterium]|nr:aspartate/glutamate racemase family protein [Spirochaetaceae bacterium]HPE88831.1 aspartate/glutamate racemase family protein [Spirochaetales bacterium]HRW24302.1 aspartate/glutamate racemase family protein [Spirochaetia bacterium]
MGSEKSIVIGGGVGPMAGVALHAKIVENTLTDGSDQSHLSVYHYSRSADVPDRTAYLLALARGEAPTADPAAGMAAVFEDAARALGGRPAVGGVPCNTFHAPAIFDRFAAEAGARAPGIRIVHMLEETVRLLEARLPRAVRGVNVGVLSTTGTRLSGVYTDLLARAGCEAVYVSEDSQELLHGAIYDREWGIKAASPVTARAAETVSAMAAELVRAGAEAVILACTELPLALGGTEFLGAPLVDPVLALARALIREAAPGKLRPL